MLATNIEKMALNGPHLNIAKMFPKSPSDSIMHYVSGNKGLG